MSKITVYCDWCNKKLERYPSQVLNSVYCSKQCRSDYFKHNHRTVITCTQCGVEKEVKKSTLNHGYKNRFCSRNCLNAWKKENYAGDKNMFFGRTHSDDTKYKISKSKKNARLTGKRSHNWNRVPVNCVECGKVTLKIPYLIKRNNNNFCSLECKGKWQSINHVGENSPRWNWGLSETERTQKRHYPEYYEFMRAVFKRDRFKCDCCGYQGTSNADTAVHHLNGYHWDKENRTNPDNAVTLCKDCHRQFHKDYTYLNNTKEQYIEFKRKQANTVVTVGSNEPAAP